MGEPENHKKRTQRLGEIVSNTQKNKHEQRAIVEGSATESNRYSSIRSKPNGLIINDRPQHWRCRQANQNLRSRMEKCCLVTGLYACLQRLLEQRIVADQRWDFLHAWGTFVRIAECNRLWGCYVSWRITTSASRSFVAFTQGFESRWQEYFHLFRVQSRWVGWNATRLCWTSRYR